MSETARVLFRELDFAIALSAHDVYLNIEDLSHLEDGVDMMTHGSSHVMRRTCLAPTVTELTGSYRETGTHVGVTKGEDRSVLIHTLCHNKLKHTVLVLRDTEIGHRACGRIELRQIAASCLSMEHGHNLHDR